MSESPARTGDRPAVTLSGYRRGRYRVVEEHDDGTLLIAPAAEGDDGGSAPAAKRLGLGMFRGLRSKQQESQSVEEMVSGWGVDLWRDERIEAFRLVDVRGQTRFAAVTNDRLILSAVGAAKPEIYPLAGSTAELHRRRRVQQLRIHWPDGSELIVSGRDDAPAGLYAALPHT